jgi:hypothetical protein
MQTKTEATKRHAEVEVPTTEAPAIDAANIPDEAEIPHQPECERVRVGMFLGG